MLNRLDVGQPVFGINLQIDSPWLVELAAVAGFDFVMLDMEHGFAASNLPVLIMAADSAGITSIVRVPDHSRGYLLNALEFGAGGVQVPMVEDVTQVRTLVRETKYAPMGRRGYSSVSRAAGYGSGGDMSHGERANRSTLLIAQLETETAVANAASIANEAGLDMLFFGPGDLSQSLGLFGEEHSEGVREVIARAVESVSEGIHIATSAFSQADVQYWIGLGVNCFLTSSITPIRQALEQTYQRLSSGLE